MQERQALILAHSPVVLYARPLEDPTAAFTCIVGPFAALLGYTSEECRTPGWWWDHIHADDRAAVLGRWPTLARGDHCVFEYRFRARDGSYCWLRDEAQRVPPANGEATQCVGAWSDITKRRRLEDQFRQAQKQEALGQLAGGIAHDFNNLLTVMNGYSEMLLAGLDAADPRRKVVDELRRAGERAASLTRQLLVFGSKQVVAPQVLDINALIRDLEKLLRRILGEDIALATALAATRPVLADSGQVDQVLLNLAVNARDAMPRGGRLTIDTRDVELDAAYTRLHPGVAPGPYVRLTVSDTGCGMTPEVQAHIFEPFFTTKEPARGTGLGLATVYGIVQQAGGHIDVYSEPGCGATFRVYLPWARRTTHTGTTMVAVPTTPGGHETVLLVEDEDCVRKLLRHLLEDQGYRVLDAPGGPEALAVFQQDAGPIDLLITDVVMPGMGGQQLADAVQERYPQVRVLFVSGYADDAIMRHGVLPDRVYFMQKPFAAAALLRMVRDVLDAPPT
jgi:PAS domain S-box-containing protein